MDRTGRVNGVYRRLKNAQQAERIRAEPPPLPGNGPYRVIVADPPWPYELAPQGPVARAASSPTRRCPSTRSARWRSRRSSQRRLRAVAVGAVDAARHMRTGARVLDAWGFEPKNILTWAKDKMATATGCAARPSTASWPCAASRSSRSPIRRRSLRAPVRGHSPKPVEFYDLVE